MGNRILFLRNQAALKSVKKDFEKEGIYILLVESKGHTRKIFAAGNEKEVLFFSG